MGLFSRGAWGVSVMGRKLVVMDIVGVSQFRQALPRQWFSHHLIKLKQSPMDQLQAKYRLLAFTVAARSLPAEPNSTSSRNGNDRTRGDHHGRPDSFESARDEQCSRSEFKAQRDKLEALL